jgi:hypothetical protein
VAFGYSHRRFKSFFTKYQAQQQAAIDQPSRPNSQRQAVLINHSLCHWLKYQPKHIADKIRTQIYRHLKIGPEIAFILLRVLLLRSLACVTL